MKPVTHVSEELSPMSPNKTLVRRGLGGGRKSRWTNPPGVPLSQGGHLRSGTKTDFFTASGAKRDVLVDARETPPKRLRRFPPQGEIFRGAEFPLDMDGRKALTTPGSKPCRASILHYFSSRPRRLTIIVEDYFDHRFLG